MASPTIRDNWQAGDEIGGVTVLVVECDSGLARERRYRVRYACCGDERSIRHAPLQDRVRKGSQACPTCSRKTNSRNFAAKNVDVMKRECVQGAELGGKRILSVIESADGPYTNTRYEVRCLGCERVTTLTYASMYWAMRHGKGGCTKCSSRLRDASRPLHLVGSADVSLVPFPAWPKPESVDGGRWPRW